MPIPAYYRSHGGHVYRVQRTQVPTDAGVRYVLRALNVDGVAAPAAPVAEVAQEVNADVLREKIQLGQAIAPAEQTYEQLWQQLRLDLDSL